MATRKAPTGERPAGTGVNRRGGERRAARRDAAVLALLEAPSIREAARRAGVADSTLRTWLAENDFAERVRAARRALYEHGLGRLQALVGAAAETLERNLACGKPSDENTAARTILDGAARAADFFDTDERLRALEEQLAGDARDDA